MGGQGLRGARRTIQGRGQRRRFSWRRPKEDRPRDGIVVEDEYGDMSSHRFHLYMWYSILKLPASVSAGKGGGREGGWRQRNQPRKAKNWMLQI